MGRGRGEVGCALYTPTPGHSGLDSCSYHWVYNGLDYWTHQVIGTTTTNIATESIQVGNWVDLVPETSYGGDVHQSILGVGDGETATLTLQNPRSNGVLGTCYWALYFDRSQIRVYDAAGNELLPGPSILSVGGATYLAAVAGEQEITLTVVGVSAGYTTLTAKWCQWASDHSDGYLCDPWYWGATQQVNYTVVGVDIYDINRGGKKITDLTSTIIVGQENHLIGVVTPSNLVATDPNWFIQVDGRGNDPIANYVQTTNYGLVTPLLPQDLQSQSVNYYWIADGQNLAVTYSVTIDGHRYGAQTAFNVLRPEAELKSVTTKDSKATTGEDPVDVGRDSRFPSNVSLHFGSAHSDDTVGIT